MFIPVGTLCATKALTLCSISEATLRWILYVAETRGLWSSR